MAEATAAFAALTTLFGVYQTLKVARVGFDVGARWLRKV